MVCSVPILVSPVDPGVEASSSKVCNLGIGQLSAESGEWYTPPEWIERVRHVLGSFYDPCSSEAAQSVVQADGWSVMGLEKLHWGPAWFCNPPGSCRRIDLGVLDKDGKPARLFTQCGNLKRCSCKLPRKFLERAIQEAKQGRPGIFLMFSVNQLRTLAQLARPRVGVVHLAVPQKRIAYLAPVTMEPKKGTSFDSAFLYLGGRVRGDTFADTFRRAGCLVLEESVAL